MFTDAAEALQWVMGRRSRNHTVAYFAEAMAAAGSPQEAFRTVHVTGTNGKGSTCYYLNHILQSAGLKTGLFTSPHLVTHYDRMRINDACIEPEVFMNLLNRHLDLIEQYDLGMFEIDVLLACTWFKEEQADIAVIEAGLGGKGSPTNIMKQPALEIITTVGYDHMERLGNTLEAIAEEKSGIIMPGSTILTGNLLAGPLAVVRDAASAAKAVHVPYEPYTDLGPGRFSWRHTEYELSTLAEYQKANASLALQAAALLGIDPSSDMVREAVRTTLWAGRFETACRKPLVVLDGAHNTEGIGALCASLKNLPRPLVIVYSALKDKQGLAMADMLMEHADEFIVTEFSMYRADTAEHLAEHGGLVISDWHEAIRTAVRRAGQNGSVLICGSLYFISDVRGWLEQNPGLFTEKQENTGCEESRAAL